MTKMVPYSVLVHGPSKVGKSTLLLTAPPPILYLDVEGQTRFLPGQEYRYDWDLTSPFEPPDNYRWVRVKVDNYSTFEHAYDVVASSKSPFRSVAIDSVSELQQRYVDKIAGTNQMQIQDWGEILRGLAMMVRRFRDLLDDGVIDVLAMTAMTGPSKSGNKDVPMLQGKMATMLPYFLDVVGYMLPYSDTVNGVHTRRLYVEPHMTYDAGSRIPWIAGHIDNPNLTDMITASTTEEKEKE